MDVPWLVSMDHDDSCCLWPLVSEWLQLGHVMSVILLRAKRKTNMTWVCMDSVLISRRSNLGYIYVVSSVTPQRVEFTVNQGGFLWETFWSSRPTRSELFCSWFPQLAVSFGGIFQSTVFLFNCLIYFIELWVLWGQNLPQVCKTIARSWTLIL